MKRLMPCLLLALAMPVLAGDAPPGVEEALAFADKVEACEAGTHSSPHPLIRGFVIEHAVAGSGEDGRCDYSQTMPGNMRMECRFDEQHRGGFAEQLREQAHGRMSGGTGQQPPWASDCEIVMADGKRQKMSG